MPLATALKNHIELCEEIYSLILEENRILKNSGQAPDNAFLDRKRDYLERLDQSMLHIRQSRANVSPGAFREYIQKAQQIVLKILLLDRENEQLLLKCGMRKAIPQVKPPSSHLQKIYRHHAGL